MCRCCLCAAQKLEVIFCVNLRWGKVAAAVKGGRDWAFMSACSRSLYLTQICCRCREHADNRRGRTCVCWASECWINYYSWEKEERKKYGLFWVVMIWRVFICDAFGIAASLEISVYPGNWRHVALGGTARQTLSLSSMHSSSFLEWKLQGAVLLFQHMSVWWSHLLGSGPSGMIFSGAEELFINILSLSGGL